MVPIRELPYGRGILRPHLEAGQMAAPDYVSEPKIPLASPGASTDDPRSAILRSTSRRCSVAM